MDFRCFFNYDSNLSIDYCVLGRYYMRNHGFSISVTTPRTAMILFNFYALTVHVCFKYCNSGPKYGSFISRSENLNISTAAAFDTFKEWKILT
jgi:hypothetical protein